MLKKIIYFSLIITLVFSLGCVDDKKDIKNESEVLVIEEIESEPSSDDIGITNSSIEKNTVIENEKYEPVYNYLIDWTVDYDKVFDMYYDSAPDGQVYATAKIHIENIGNDSIVIDTNQFSFVVDGIEYVCLNPTWSDLIDVGNVPIRTGDKIEIKKLYLVYYPNDFNSSNINYYGLHKDEFKKIDYF